eukprot:TRINITY_DN68194_c0_g1_i2.p2 TRINITY_DN68194_c0_g1~~TRINITY_DN68194_c0_g1_i2.p2  ORF type:complete len:143 (+),score=24.24 TRINITY_DN68194_c0_g1_i2:274-702(+)
MSAQDTIGSQSNLAYTSEDDFNEALARKREKLLDPFDPTDNIVSKDMEISEQECQPQHSILLEGICDELKSGTPKYIRDLRFKKFVEIMEVLYPVSYTHLRAHETSLHLVCRLLLEKKKNKHNQKDLNRKRESILALMNLCN